MTAIPSTPVVSETPSTPISTPVAVAAVPPASGRHQAAGGMDRLANRAVMGLIRLGIGVWGARTLEVKGRTSGQPRRVPVNVLSVDGVKYLVSPRGETQWVRNLRAAGRGRLLLGRRATEFTAEEVPPSERPPLLRSYLQRWGFEVGSFFDDVDGDSTDAELAAIAHHHPVFRLNHQ